MWITLLFVHYCTILFNLAPSVVHYQPAKILISALSEFCHDKARNSAIQHHTPPNFTTYVATVITKWFQHWKKLPVTTITFQQFWRPCDMLLLNWIKWYSNIANSYLDLYCSSCDIYSNIQYLIQWYGEAPGEDHWIGLCTILLQ